MTHGASTTLQQDEHLDQAGAVLVVFALLLVGLFGLLGVVIDGGRLRVTKQQLDAGAEVAALEGLRFKDRDGDAARRMRAITAIEWQWDDDLDASNGDILALGAGSLPIVAAALPLGGELQVAATPANRAWKPATQLQANPGNAVHGDMVAGSFVTGQLPSEDDTFQRPDFVPVPGGSAAAQLASASSFLVRLRRATGRLALDRQPGESSSGPAFEWLWARGSAWQEPQPGGSMQSRSDGLTLRATAIAATERALVVSDNPVPVGGGRSSPLLTRIALRGDPASAWHATAPGGSLTLDIGGNGLLTLAGNEQGLGMQTIVRSVSKSLIAAPTAFANLPSSELIVPVYGTINGERVVIGFTLATATFAGNSLTITRQQSAVLPVGASSTSPAALDAHAALQLAPALRALHTAFAQPVLAPVLRR
jgi:hypothetical protein